MANTNRRLVNSTQPRQAPLPQNLAQEAPLPAGNELADITALAGIPSQGGQVDIAGLIASLLTPPAPVAAPRPSLLSNIANSLGSGIAVATSRDPGAALQQQMGARQQMEFAREQAAREQSDRMNQIRQQFGLSLVNQQLDEGRELRKEGRMSKARKEERQAEEEASIRRFNLEMTGKERLENLSSENQKKFYLLQESWQREKESNTNERFDKKEAQDLILKKIDGKLGLVRAGLSVGLATSITNKWFNDEPLTKAEEGALTAAAQKALRATSGGGGGGGRGGGGGGTVGVSDKATLRVVDGLLVDAVKTQYAELQDGTFVEVSSIPKHPVTGRHIGVKRMLSSEESGTYAATKVIPSILRARQAILNPQAQVQTPQNTTGQGPVAPTVRPSGFNVNNNAFARMAADNAKPVTSIQRSDQYQRAFDGLLQQGATPAKAASMLREAIGVEIPKSDSILVDGIINRNLNSGRFPRPTVSARKNLTVEETTKASKKRK